MAKYKNRTVPAVLTYEQVLEILSKVDFEEAILVGGQAVLMYASVFNLDNIELGISGDIDLIGKAKTAQALAAKLKNTTITLASLDSNSLNSAVLAVDLNDDEFFQIDFLTHISGVDSSTLEKRVEKLDVVFSEDGLLGANRPLVVKIINPLDLLTSKLYNYVAIPSKRDEQGNLQAKLAIEIAKNYLQGLADSGDKSFNKALKAFCDQCLTAEYVEADARYGLKAFAILEHLKGYNPLFLEKDYPVRKKTYNKKIKAYQKLMQFQLELSARKPKP